MVAVDFGPTAAATLRYGGALARAYRSALHVVHVLAGGRASAGAADGTVSAESAQAHQRLSELLAGVEAGAPWPAPPVVVVLQADAVAVAILDYARAHRADVVVLGAHGESSFDDFYMGSVVQKVVRSAACPVLTVRGAVPA